jgi:hypothetical protein
VTATAGSNPCLVRHRVRDYTHHVEMPINALQLRSAGSAGVDDLSFLQPPGGATAASGRSTSGHTWCGTHDQSHSLLDPLHGHERYTYVRDLHR